MGGTVQPALGLVFLALQQSFPLTHRQTKHTDGFLDGLGFDLVVQFRVNLERRGVVHLHEHRAHVLVDEHVESQQFEATGGSGGNLVRTHVRCRAVAVGALEVRRHRDKRFHNQLFDGLSQGCCVVPLRAEGLHHRRQSALAPFVWVALGRHVLVRMLVDGVVGQMHVHGVEVAYTRGLVLGCGKARQSLVKQIDSKRIDARHQHVEPQVELVLVYKEGLVDVLLHNPPVEVRIAEIQILFSLHQVDAAAHRPRVGLDDVRHPPPLAAPLPTLRAPLAHLLRQGPRPREEGVVLGVHAAHRLQVPGQGGFPTNLHHAREVVDALEGEHARHALRGHREIRPVQVPHVTVLRHLFEFQHLGGHFAHNLVLAIDEVHLQSLVLFLGLRHSLDISLSACRPVGPPRSRSHTTRVWQ
mmetsp:Transcript_27030/g.51481  ORF Transcript_27030/g.51481 Transcript_27030/m.51481 type:complete len:413 (-) Transcript_27030:565-1803(-)